MRFVVLESHEGLAVYEVPGPLGEQDGPWVFAALGERVTGADLDPHRAGERWLLKSNVFTDLKDALDRAAVRSLELARVYTQQCTLFLDEKKDRFPRLSQERPSMPTRFERDPQV